MNAKSVAATASVLGFIFATVSHVSPFWLVLTEDENGHSVYSGLWQVCGKNPGSVLMCVSADSDDSSISSDVITVLHIVRYLNMPTPCLLLASCLCAVLGAKNRSATVIASVCSGFAVCLLVGSYTTFAVKTHSNASERATFHFCFYGDIIASILALISSTASVKLAMSITATVTPLHKSNIHNVRMQRHVRHGIMSSRDSRFAASRIGTAGLRIHIPHIILPDTPPVARRMHYDHEDDGEIWRLYESQRSSRNCSPRDPPHSCFLHPGTQPRGISRESRDSWLSVDIDIFPTPPGSASGRKMAHTHRNLDF